MSLLNQPHSQYKEMQVKTASQLKLILMLYDEAIRCLKIAVANNQFEKYNIFNRNLLRAQDVITELMLAINQDKGDFAKRLYHLYEYINHELVNANIKKDGNAIEKVKKQLEELRHTWSQLDKKNDDTNSDETQTQQIDFSS